MSTQCRSDCRAPVTRLVVMVSKSGRRWVNAVCADDEHLAEAHDIAGQLGFTVVRVDAVEPV